jgi:hypothetical protein
MMISVIPHRGILEIVLCLLSSLLLEDLQIFGYHMDGPANSHAGVITEEECARPGRSDQSEGRWPQSQCGGQQPTVGPDCWLLPPQLEISLQEVPPC